MQKSNIIVTCERSVSNGETALPVNISVEERGVAKWKK